VATVSAAVGPDRIGPGAAAPWAPSLADVRERYAVLEHAPCLFELPEGWLRALARRSRSHLLAAGATLFSQGEAGDAMYVVRSGGCQISVTGPAGAPVAVALAGPGDSVGEDCLLGDARGGTVRAVVDSELVVLDREALASVLLEGSEEAEQVLRMAHQRRAGAWLLAGWADRIGGAGQARSIAVYSPKGGSGRTTLALNLAAQLARVHPGEVALVDLALPYNDAALMANLVPVGALALLGETAAADFEEALMSTALPHPAGFVVLPSALRPEQAELVGAELVERAAEVLRRSFRFVIFDLSPQLSSATLAVLEGADDLLLPVSAELSALKDLQETLRVLEEVLRIPRSRGMVALNHRCPPGVIDRAAAERALGQPVACEIGFEGAKLEQAAVRGELLVLSEPRGPMALATTRIAAMVDPQEAAVQQPPPRKRKLRGLR
jgi:Flp pilus assembly CpaE family ATPase